LYLLLVIVVDILLYTTGDVIVYEGGSALLSCNYTTKSENIYLFWYRQLPNQAPEYLLYKGARTYSRYEGNTNARFNCTTSRDTTQLTISSLTIADTAIYYCALRDAQ
uniref:Ig-like domain-containing protein n=1 Tax=Paramormyrops kingsleyae TaxID=1676925 RepID=A0A3B3Q4H5_9TELE